MTEELKGFNIQEFRTNLIDWFNENKRVLPWRESNDAYRVWVSEIMLQQTRVDTVIPYYEAFMRKFPSANALADATEDELLKAWEGLGYYSRVRNLQSAVREVVAEYGGTVPKTREEITRLKGVGPYTAGAVLSIAYNLPEPAVDGNVMRVLSRVLLIEQDIAKASTRKIFEQILYELISKEDPSSFNQGLMELGALVCTPTSPGCLLCPVRGHCRAYDAGLETSLPVKSKKKKQAEKQMAAIIIRNDNDEVLIEKRPNTGLLASLWQFPNIETFNRESQESKVRTALATQYEVNAHISASIQTVKHIFSHIIWFISVYEVQVEGRPVTETKKRKWVNKKDIEQYAFPVSHQKIIQQSL